MSWRTDLIVRLRADAGVAAALGTRVAWIEAGGTWSAYPQLVLHEISPGREYTHDGPDGLDRPRVQFDVWGQGIAQLEAAEAALLTVMEAGGDQGATRFHEAALEDRETGVEDLSDQVRIHRLRMDFTFFFETV